VSGDNYPEVNLRLPVAILEKLAWIIWISVQHLVTQPFSGKFTKNIFKDNEMASEKPVWK
jgi:hypothetical protein